MDYSCNTFTTMENFNHSCIVLPVYIDGDRTKYSRTTNIIDGLSGGKIKEFIKNEDFKATLGRAHLFYNLGDQVPLKVLIVGCGSEGSLNLGNLGKLVESMYSALEFLKAESIGIAILDDIDQSKIEQFLTQFVIVSEGAFYSFDCYLKEPKHAERSKLEQVDLLFTRNVAVLDHSLMQGVAIAKGMTVARDLANHPSNVCTPNFIAKKARQLEADHPCLLVEILEENELEALGMNAFLSISKGSAERGKVIILEYNGSNDTSLCSGTLNLAT